MQNGNHENCVFYAAIVNQTNTSPDVQRQQLTMTGVAGVENIEDGLAAPRRPPPKYSTSLAHVACVT